MSKPQNPPCTMLRVSGADIVDAAGNKIILKGAGLGGFLNMENFITGYSGHEFEHRAQLAEVLGPEDAQFYFDRLIHHFFTDEDAAFYASLGLNCIRIPFNYRHFIDDLNPDVLKPEGFALIDRCVEICARHNIYVALDLHAAPGGQNQDWHSDSGIARAMFWDFKDHQDRAVALWEKLAAHYKGNPVIAGYNPLNEPADPTADPKTGHHGARLVAWYARVEKAIRAIDPDHILFIDGNTYAMDFRAFPPEPLPNAVYAMHDYSPMGFPTAAQQYEGTSEQKAKLRASFERKVEFMRQHGVPVWNGEFGPVYADPRTMAGDGAIAEAEGINAKRLALLREQLAIYAETGISWSIWLYKDIGYQGMVYTDPASPYMKLIRPFIEKKEKLGVDFWGIVDKNKVNQEVYEPFTNALKAMIDPRFHQKKYPKIWTFERQVERVVRECLLSEYLGWELAELFRGKTRDELEALAASFALRNCKQREGLNEILRKDVLGQSAHASS
ncbi:endoglucanase C [Apiospora arundinis]|uniref:Endoglucanase C n=1 Tax=Apiospora arundinis TaxID=335852 RepID=A0ABR2JBG5_9PEZI